MNTKNLIPGQAIAIRSAYGHSFSLGWVVKRVTPSGQVVVNRDLICDKKNDRRFNHDGMEMSEFSTKYHCAMLVDAAYAQAETDKHARRVAATNALAAVKVDGNTLHWCKDTLLGEIARLEALLAEARKLTEAM